MPLIQAWECPRSGKLFKSPDDYREHLKARARESLGRRRVRRKIAGLDERFAELRRCSDIESIIEWLEAEENQETLWINAWMRDSFFDPKKLDTIDPTGFRLYGVKIGRLRWEDHISNTHEAPLGMPTNFGRDRFENGLPTGYPGYRARIGFHYMEPLSIQKQYKSFNFKGTGITTGGGGGGIGEDGNPYRGYELYLFADDWPSLAVAEKLRQPW